MIRDSLIGSLSRHYSLFELVVFGGLDGQMQLRCPAFHAACRHLTTLSIPQSVDSPLSNVLENFKND
jgi:hypothetical protein